MGNDFIKMVNNLIKTVNDFSLIWSITSSKGTITLADGSIGTVNNFMILFSMREKFQTPENWFWVENGFTLLNSTNIEYSFFSNVSYCLLVYINQCLRLFCTAY
mgnify:CR=1 FL=1